MRVYRSLEDTPADFGPSALTIGNFDGVHAGHRRILRRLKALAASRGWKPSVLTFDPHPTRVVAPERAPQLMTSPGRRAELMTEEGVEQVLVLPFDRQVSLLSPEEFVGQLLVERLGARAVVVGDNFRFGHRQAGNVALLQRMGQELGFDTEIVPAVNCRGQVVSSSGIRRLISAGRVAMAGRFLEHPFRLDGEVVSGRGVGSRETVPTLNLAPAAGLVPAAGVYITRTSDLESSSQWDSLTNVGYRPTFGESDRLTIETFLLGPLTSPAPRRIAVEFLERLREERKFETPEALKARILQDVAVAQRYFRRRAAWTERRCRRRFEMSTGQYLLNGLRIIFLDLLLAGDNALVIAMAVRPLPRRERRIGIACGAALAVLLRIALTLVAVRLLTLEYLKLAGGLLVLWIAWKLMGDVSEPPDEAAVPKRLLQAIWYVVFADLTMSTDNILAIAAAANGHWGLIVFGLCVSIPFVVFSSNLLADLMNRWPATIYLGVAILGQVGAEMALTDPAIERVFHPSNLARHAIEAAVVVALLLVGRLMARRKASAAQ